MATPMHFYNEIEERYGVNPTDEQAVDRFFEYRLPRLPQKAQQAILDELLARNGETVSQATPGKTLQVGVGTSKTYLKRAAAAPHR